MCRFVIVLQFGGRVGGDVVVCTGGGVGSGVGGNVGGSTAASAASAVPGAALTSAAAVLASTPGASGSNKDSSSQLDTRTGAADSGGAEGGQRDSVAVVGVVACTRRAVTTKGMALLPTEEPTGKSASLVLGYLIAILRTKALPTWKGPSLKKALVPAGTTASPFGKIAIKKKRSLWCPGVHVAGIKPAFNVPAFGARRLNLGDVDDVIFVSAVTMSTYKTIAEVIAALIALCALEPRISSVVRDTVEASYAARPARHLPLGLYGREVDAPVHELRDGVGSAGKPAGAAAAEMAAAAAASADPRNVAAAAAAGASGSPGEVAAAGAAEEASYPAAAESACNEGGAEGGPAGDRSGADVEVPPGAAALVTGGPSRGSEPSDDSVGARTVRVPGGVGGSNGNGGECLVSATVYRRRAMWRSRRRTSCAQCLPRQPSVPIGSLCGARRPQ